MLSRIPRAVLARKMRDSTARFQAVLPSRIPCPVKAASTRRHFSRVAIAATVKDATLLSTSVVVRATSTGSSVVVPTRIPAPVKTASTRRYISRVAVAVLGKDATLRRPGIHSVKGADIVSALASMSISTTDNLDPPSVSSDDGTRSNPLSKATPAPCQFIAGRRRPQRSFALSSAAEASVEANITARHERVASRISSIGSSVSTSSSSQAIETPASWKAAPRQWIRYPRQTYLRSQGYVTMYRISEYVKIPEYLYEMDSRIPTMPTGWKSHSTRTLRPVTPGSGRIKVTLTHEVSLRGQEPYVFGKSCLYRLPYKADVLHADNYRDEEGFFCPYCTEEFGVADKHVLPRLWATTPAEAAVNPNRPRKVRFVKGLESSVRFFVSDRWTAVDEKRTGVDKWSLFNKESLDQVRANTYANERPSLEHDWKFQAIKTKFGTRYERRASDKLDLGLNVDAAWEENSAKISEILASWKESSDDSFSESDFF